MSDRLYCRICCGVRPMTDKLCLGCNTPRANAAVPVSKKTIVTAPPKCPGCGLSHSITLEPGRWRCAICNAVFEKDDFSWLDDRAERNLEKKERQGRR